MGVNNKLTGGTAKVDTETIIDDTPSNFATLDIYNKVRSVPKSAQKTISAGRLKGMTDINPMWRIKMLTELFGVCGVGWYTEITKQWLEVGSDGTIAAFINLNLYVKIDGEWSKPIVGTGGSMFVAKEQKGLYTSDEAYKMAYTDALSICCKALGFGADVYWSGDRTKYNNTPEEPKSEPTQNSKTTTGTQNPNAKITAQQQLELYNHFMALANNDSSTARNLMKQMTGKTSTADFTVREYREALDKIQRSNE